MHHSDIQEVATNYAISMESAYICCENTILQIVLWMRNQWLHYLSTARRHSMHCGTDNAHVIECARAINSP